MLKKYFVEITVWATLIVTLIGSVVMTYKVRYAMDNVNAAIAAGHQTANTNIVTIRTKGGTEVSFGYAKVREDLKDRYGWVRPEIDGTGFYLCIYEK